MAGVSRVPDTSQPLAAALTLISDSAIWVSFLSQAPSSSSVCWRMRGFLVAELLGEGADGAVAGDLVVLDALGCGDQGRVADVRVPARLDRLLALGDQPLHRLAGLALRVAYP